MKRIDTDMTAAYLNAVQKACEEANKEMEGMEAFAKDLNHSYETMTKAFERQRDRADKLEEEVKKLKAEGSKWHPATETPPDGTRCIIRTNEGATFMFEPICGKWPQWINKWMYIPE